MEAAGRPMTWRRALHRALDAVHRAWGPGIGRSGFGPAWVGLLDAVVSLQSDRRYMRRAILPAARRAGFGRILFVGCRGYTRAYGRAFDGTGAEFWTADIDPDAARWGEPGRHMVCDACRLDAHFPPDAFDFVMLNGVLGWGIDGEANMNRALAAAHAVLRPGGLLLLGWNSDRIDDPGGLANLRALFAPTGFADLPQRRDFPDVTHVFAFYRRR